MKAQLFLAALLLVACAHSAPVVLDLNINSFSADEANKPLTGYFNGEPNTDYTGVDPTSLDHGVTVSGAVLQWDATASKIYATGITDTELILASTRVFKKLTITFAYTGPGSNIGAGNEATDGFLYFYNRKDELVGQIRAFNTGASPSVDGVFDWDATPPVADGAYQAGTTTDKGVVKMKFSKKGSTDLKIWKVELDSFEDKAACDLLDTHACGGRGTCIAYGIGGLCSCFSGYAAPGCAFRQETTTGTNEPFAPAPVSNDAVDFKPETTITFATGSAITLTVVLPSAQSAGNKEGNPSYSQGTHFYFKKGSDNGQTTQTCGFPNDVTDGHKWSYVTSEINSVWVDTYQRTFGTFSELNSACGFDKVENTPTTTDISSYLVVERKFVTGNGRFSFSRTASTQEKVTLKFPRQISSKNTVIVANNTVDFFASVAQLSYSPLEISSSEAGTVIPAGWQLVLETAIAFPYKINNQAPTWTGFLKANGANRASSYLKTVDIVKTGVSSCSNSDPTLPCLQKHYFSVEDCKAIDYDKGIFQFMVQCRAKDTGVTGQDTGTNCPNANTPAGWKVTATVSLKTTTACPFDATYTITPDSLAFYQGNADNAASATLYGTSETVYTRTTFALPPAEISSISVIAVCAFPSPFVFIPGQLCSGYDSRYSLAGEDYSSGATQIPSNSDTNKALKKVSIGRAEKLVNKAYPTDTSYTHRTLTVQVDLKITYSGSFRAGTKKREVDGESQYAHSSIGSIAIGDIQENAQVESSSATSIIASFALVVLLSVLLC